MTIRAAIYARVSTAQQEPGTSLESQRAACHRLAAELGAAIVAEYQDVDSGAKENIPGLLALTEAARRREFDVVLVDHPDRFSRNLVKKVILRRDLLKTGVELRYAALRVEDSAEGRLMENMTAVIAEYERERITFRTNRGRYAKARQGHVVGTGAPPYGYEYVRDGDTIRSLQPDPVTAPIARRILTDLIDVSATTLVERLSAEGIPPPRGLRWHPASILKMARNPVYSGRAAYGQWEWQDRKLVGPRSADTWTFADVPPLVDPVLWTRLQESIADRRLQGRARMIDDPYALRGLLRCGHCGGMVAAHQNNGHRYYVCLRRFPATAARQGAPRCELAAAPADALEDLIISSVRAVLLDTGRLRRIFEHEHVSAEASRVSSADAIGRDVERHERRLSQIHELLIDATPGTSTWTDLRRRAQDAQTQITRLEAERERSATLPDPVSDEMLASLEAFAASIRGQIDTDTSASGGWQEILAALRIRVTVRNDAQGWQLGPRKRNRFGLEIEAAIPIDLLHRKNVFSNIAHPRPIRIPLVGVKTA